MGFIRKDPVLGRHVYYAVSRKQRPQEFVKKIEHAPSSVDFFAPGNEHLTPPEIGRTGTAKTWELRWFLNKFAAVEKKGSPAMKGGLFSSSSNYGIHEVIVETRKRDEQLAETSVDHIATLLKVYRERIAASRRVKGIRYVIVFKNHGKDAGTSLVHEHSQVVGIPHLPSSIIEKSNASRASPSAYRQMVAKESASKRAIMKKGNFTAFCPFASRFNYEAWIYPTTAIRSLDDFSEKDFVDCAAILKHILSKLNDAGLSYNYYLQYSPAQGTMPFHIEITPRKATWAGFELGTGAIINSILPETAAQFYRKKASKK